MHEGLCWELTMLELIVETFIFGKGIVVAIELREWLLCNWQFGIFTQLKLVGIISETRMHFSSLW